MASSNVLESNSAPRPFSDTMREFYKRVEPTFSGSVTRGVSTAFSTVAHAVAAPVAACVYVNPRIKEANRQIDRLRSVAEFDKDWDGQGSKAVDPASMAYATMLIGKMASSCLPVPLASVGSEGNSSLFIKAENFYGDIEVVGSSVEYLLKFNSNGTDHELSGCEPIEDGNIPPNLLVNLFARLAKV